MPRPEMRSKTLKYGHRENSRAPRGLKSSSQKKVSELPSNQSDMAIRRHKKTFSPLALIFLLRMAERSDRYSINPRVKPRNPNSL